MNCASLISARVLLGQWRNVWFAFSLISVIDSFSGNEYLLTTGPPIYVFVTMLLTAILYAVPAAIICADLGTAYPV
jgi:hypothetical protein